MPISNPTNGPSEQPNVIVRTPADRLQIKFVAIISGFALVISAFGSVGVYAINQQSLSEQQKVIASLCEQSKITDGLVLTAINLVSAPPNPEADQEFISTFSKYHQQIITNKACFTGVEK